MRKHQYRHSIESVCDWHHLSPAEILARVQKLHPNISQATVYRNIEAMSQEWTLRKIASSCGRVFYERVMKKHAHLVNETESQIYDFSLNNLHIENIPDWYEISEVCIYIRKKNS